MPLYTPAEMAACFAALKTLEQKDVPWYAQSQISDDLLKAIVDNILTTYLNLKAKETYAKASLS